MSWVNLRPDSIPMSSESTTDMGKAMLVAAGTYATVSDISLTE